MISDPQLLWGYISYSMWCNRIARLTFKTDHLSWFRLNASDSIDRYWKLVYNLLVHLDCRRICLFQKVIEAPACWLMSAVTIQFLQCRMSANVISMKKFCLSWKRWNDHTWLGPFILSHFLIWTHRTSLDVSSFGNVPSEFVDVKDFRECTKV